MKKQYQITREFERLLGINLTTGRKNGFNLEKKINETEKEPILIAKIIYYPEKQKICYVKSDIKS